MQELIDTCAATGFRQMIGYIDADNTAFARHPRKIRLSQGGAASGHRLSIRPLGRHRHGATLTRCRFDRASADIELRPLIGGSHIATAIVDAAMMLRKLAFMASRRHAC
jgi:hypothetical protein